MPRFISERWKRREEPVDSIKYWLQIEGKVVPQSWITIRSFSMQVTPKAVISRWDRLSWHHHILFSSSRLVSEASSKRKYPTLTNAMRTNPRRKEQWSRSYKTMRVGHYHLIISRARSKAILWARWLQPAQLTLDHLSSKLLRCSTNSTAVCLLGKDR
jgi:hypothetical protein